MLQALRSCRVRFLFVVVVAALSAGRVLADPWGKYSDTAFIAPLPGSLFGVTPDGKIGFDGAMNIAVPTAYTPGPGSIVIAGNVGSTREHRLPNNFQGSGANGSFIPAGLGMSVLGHHVYACDMWTSKDIESLVGLQIELRPQTGDWPSIAVGCSDLFAARGPITDPHSVRSVYAVATLELTKADMPTYLTLGYGNRRYRNRPIGALSIQPWDNLKFTAEYDGWGTNLLAAYKAWGNGDGWNAVLYGQYQGTRYPGLGITVTHSR